MAFSEEKELETTKEASEEVVVEETVTQEPETEVVIEKTNSKKSKNKKPSKIKAAFSELKKVTWPTFPSVVKKTAVVLTVTLVFLVVIIGIDQLLYLLYNLLTKNM